MIAGIDELCLRARPCDPGAAEGAGGRAAARCRSAPGRNGWPAPTRSACRSGASSRSTVPVGDGRRDASARGSTSGASALPRPLASPAQFELSRRPGCASPFRCRQASTLGEPYVFPPDDGPVDYAAPQAFRRNGDMLIAELKRRRGEPASLSGVLALGDGRGLEFKAAPGRGARRRQPCRRAGRHGAAAGRCSARWPAACCST